MVHCRLLPRRTDSLICFEWRVWVGSSLFFFIRWVVNLGEFVEKKGKRWLRVGVSRVQGIIVFSVDMAGEEVGTVAWETINSAAQSVSNQRLYQYIEMAWYLRVMGDATRGFEDKKYLLSERANEQKQRHWFRPKDKRQMYHSRLIRLSIKPERTRGN